MSTYLTKYTLGPWAAQLDKSFSKVVSQQELLVSLSEGEHQLQRETILAIDSGRSNLREVLETEFANSSDMIREALADLGLTISDDIASTGYLISRTIEGAVEQVNDGLAAVHNAVESLSNRVEGLTARVDAQTVIFSSFLARSVAVLEQLSENQQQSLSVEAQQLVDQGLRHLRVGQVRQAKERFQLALTKNSTFFSALVGAAQVSIREGQTDEALRFLEDALSLPENLNKRAQATVRWEMARVAYSVGDFRRAAAHAHAAALADPEDPQTNYREATYAAAAADSERTRALLRKAGQCEPKLLLRALVDPSFASMRDEALSVFEERLRQVQLELEKKKIGAATLADTMVTSPGSLHIASGVAEVIAAIPETTKLGLTKTLELNDILEKLRSTVDSTEAKWALNGIKEADDLSARFHSIGERCRLEEDALKTIVDERERTVRSVQVSADYNRAYEALLESVSKDPFKVDRCKDWLMGLEQALKQMTKRVKSL